MQTLICCTVLLFWHATRAALVCPHFADRLLTEQPIVKDCATDLTHECVSFTTTPTVFLCISQRFFVDGDNTTTDDTFEQCEAPTCRQESDPCTCTPQLTVCERSIQDESLPRRLLCIDAPTTTATPTTSTANSSTKTVPNYCDEDDDLTVNCTVPRDDTALFLMVFFGIFAGITLCFFCILRSPDGSNARRQQCQ